RPGTVPALAWDAERVSTNRRIARSLADRPPKPSLSPADPDQRRAVEEAERWANETLQMAARRIALAWAVRDPAGSSRSVADGRMGYPLYRPPLTRPPTVPTRRP